MTNPTRKLKYGMVGGGPGAFIGAVHRIAAGMSNQADLVAGAFSRDPAKTRQTGAELFLDEARCYDDYRAMAEAEAARPEGDRIDFVSIVTPNSTHAQIATAFLEAGIHVVCDKPLTTDLASAHKLRDAVAKSGLVFALTHNYTAHPLIRHARAMCANNELGSIRKVVAEYLQGWLATPLETEGHKQAAWRADPAISGPGGALGDIGTHAHNLVETVTGQRLTAVCAQLSSFGQGRQLDDDANILFRLEHGATGTITISQVAVGEENGLSLRVYGERAGLSWRQEDPNQMDLLTLDRPRQILTRGRDDLHPTAAAATRTPPGHPEGYLEAFATIYDDAIAAIRAHQAGHPVDPASYAFPDIHAGIRGVAFIEACVASSAAGSVWTDIHPG